MFSVNNQGVKKVSYNGTTVHKVTVNGTTVFDDQCYVDWAVTYHSWGSRAGTLWTTFSASAYRNDSYPSVNAKIKVIREQYNGTRDTKYYDLPLTDEIVSDGGWSAGPFGHWKVWIYINDTLLTSWDFGSHSELIYEYSYNGRQYFYES